ncbi:Transthyretin/hydroxyisourate hydrolase domain [Bartonella choladocola]|uniref:hydroxyisourate hydrolase n=1 Tax=Bartonella TaxID=773 RepID=UPI0018DB045F|nr:hydroxyisourate hydrolase [Bartonella choladocola]MBI0141166.1 hydroxyisourate hydrolase [Bartonella choladocola]
MTGLTTHILDTASGKPASGVKIQLYKLCPQNVTENQNNGTINTPLSTDEKTHLAGENTQSVVKKLLVETKSNQDGRTEKPLLDEKAMEQGQYELHFFTAAYFLNQGVKLDNPPFLDEITISFSIADNTAHYHVPLLVSPWSYSTYRGS